MVYIFGPALARGLSLPQADNDARPCRVQVGNRELDDSLET